MMDTPRSDGTRVRWRAVKAIVVTCPHCGARLQVKGDSRDVKCEYCETHARVQRRTQFFERTLPPPQDGPKAVALQKHTKIFLWVMVLTTVLPALLVPLIIWLATRDATRTAERIQSAASEPKLPRHVGPDQPTWQGTDGILLADVDDNGSKEIVGRTRRVQRGDEVRVIALAGATGKTLWETAGLGTYTDTYQGRLSIAGDTLLFGSQRGEVKAFALATGKPKWSMKIDERVKYFCDGGAATVIVVGNDNVARPVKLADGTTTTLEQPLAAPGDKRRKKAPCAPLPGDTDEPSPRESSNYELGRPHQVSVDAVYTGPLGRVVAGTRDEGTRVGMLMLLDAAAKPVWKIVAPIDPLGSIERAPEPVAVGGSEVCAAYYEDSVAKPKRIACFAGADGKRLWDVPASSTWSLEGMVINNRALLTWSSGSIELRALDGGNVLWKFGQF